jgi:DNA-3-methyladenine glycosylase
MFPGSDRCTGDFYLKDVLELAPRILGCSLVIETRRGIEHHAISEVEAYRGEEDLACHASKGRNKRNEMMYFRGGHLYIYLIYGMHWMLNIVTGPEKEPQALLVRGLEGISGPGRLTKYLGIDKSYHGEYLVTSHRIWLEKNAPIKAYHTTPRIGIDYAGEYWMNRPWRFVVTS